MKYEACIPRDDGLLSYRRQYSVGCCTIGSEVNARCLGSTSQQGWQWPDSDSVAPSKISIMIVARAEPRPPHVDERPRTRSVCSPPKFGEVAH